MKSTSPRLRGADCLLPGFGNGIEAVGFTDLRMVHQIWHHSISAITKMAGGVTDKVDAAAKKARISPKWKFWMDMPALTAEREPHDTFDGALRTNAIMRPLMLKKGYIPLDWFAMSFARGIDGAEDGMHHYDWTALVLLQRMVNHVCNDWLLDPSNPLGLEERTGTEASWQ
jgi:hypothetical protein